MNIKKLYLRLLNLSENTDYISQLVRLPSVINEAKKRASSEELVYKEVAEYYDKVKSKAFEKLKDKDKKRCEEAKVYLERYDNRYEQWKKQAEAYVKVGRAMESTKCTSKYVTRFIRLLENFEMNFDTKQRIDEKYGRINFEEIPSGYKLKCIKECDEEICEAFGVSSIAELKNI